MARRIVCRCRSRPSSPIHAMSAAYSRSSLRSKQPPPTARHVGPHGPEPSAPHGSGPQERICSSSCLSWLHLLKSWSLRQSRGGSLLYVFWESLRERTGEWFQLDRPPGATLIPSKSPLTLKQNHELILIRHYSVSYPLSFFRIEIRRRKP